MKANELRIGNFFSIDGSIYSVANIFDETMFNGRLIKKAAGMSTNGGRKSPIPLTPEILEKCGFYQLPHFTIQNIWKKDLGRDRVLTVACVGTPNEMVFISEEETPVVKHVIVARNYDYDGNTYLHHIQNLYSDFTNGEELEVKL